VGNVYLAGNTLGSLPGETNVGVYDAFVRQYHSDGSKGWTRQFGTSEWEGVGDIAVDAAGTIVVAGLTHGVLSGQTTGQSGDVFVRQYHSDGSEGWTHQFGTAELDQVGGLAIDQSGAIYVSGSTIGTWPGQHYAGGVDAYLMKLRPTDSPATNPSTPIPPFPSTADRAYFPETGHALGAGFKGFWERNGGLATFGYPLTEEFTEWDHTVQFTERQRFEWHPEYSGSPYEVLLGRLGAELLGRQGRDWHAFPTAEPGVEHYMWETGHAIAPEFWDYWTSHGLELGEPANTFHESLALFGYPLSEPMLETNADGDTVLTQYFERAVFEYHPEHAGAPYDVLLRRLGAEELGARGW
jgi:hypothetical protein